MNKFTVLVLAILAGSISAVHGQVSGNSNYADSPGRTRAERIEQAKRILTKEEMPPTSTSSFVDANILMNVKADEYVVVFGVSREGETLAECNTKLNDDIKVFSAELKPLKISDDKFLVDFVAQNKIYGFEKEGDVFQEKLVGFELKKNVLIHYKESALLEKITLAAARAQIFDLIKVDYIVRDIKEIQDQLLAEAARVIKSKISRYEKLLAIKLRPPAQVYAEKSAIHYPTRMYNSYTAFESEAIRGGPDRQKYTVRSARKSRTFYYNGLDGDGFDLVINPVVTEPVVQFTLYLKVKYEIEQNTLK